MGEALVGGFIASELLEPVHIAIAEIDVDRRDALAARFGVRVEADASLAAEGADAVLLAVKPQQMDEVVTSLGPSLGGDVLVVSIAAGVTCGRLESLLGEGRRVVRVMPNQAAVAGLAMSAISGGSDATDDDLQLVGELMGAVGKAVILPERLMDAATALSGSGPAYVYLFAEGLIQAGVSHGLSRDQATELVVQTFRGASEMLARGGHPAELVDAVASPGGTTIAAIEAFEAAGLRAALFAGVDAAIRRAKELG